MKIIKTRETKILESIIVELDAIAKPHTTNEVYFCFKENGFLIADLQAGRRVRITILGDHDGIQMECDHPMMEGYKNHVMNRLKDSDYVKAAEYAWNWINVNEGFVMEDSILEHRIERNAKGDVVRYKQVG